MTEAGPQPDVMGALPQETDMIRWQRDHDELHTDPNSGATCADNCPGRVPGPCGQQGCKGHLGKFSDCLTEALWEASMVGGESTGSTEAYGHYTLIHFDSDTSHSMGKDLGVEDHGPEVMISAGWYMVQATEQGFVYSWACESEAIARQQFAEVDQEYSAWLDINDPEYEYHLTDDEVPLNAGSAE